MLTWSTLILCWSLAVLAVIFLIFGLVTKQFKLAGLSYLATGFFGLALPFKFMLSATTWFGMAFISLIWPIWLSQNAGFKVMDFVPQSVLALMFNV
jgi:hypothetical protein